jgi:hypothetical protein
VPDVRLGPISRLQRVPNDVGFTPANAERMLHVLPEADSVKRTRWDLPLGAISHRQALELTSASFNSPAIQPTATVFIGSLATAFVKL